MAGLEGKTALVTGSTDGVGRVVAMRLGEAGARVLVHGRDAERGAAVVAAIGERGGAAEFLQADLASLAEVRRLADLVRQRT
ncbi:MAG TPA: SDR family NAD(P)-dependent oxidoreductase, partial [Geminicoccaceae bacterium]|nr:SDR family NAD(P)-dependent oxidoreductase [Geminicoccaceae bacterium]